MATATVLHGLALVKLELNELHAATGLLADALRLAQAARCGRIEAQVLDRMGEAYLLAGELAGADDTFELALTTVRVLGDPIGEAFVLAGLGVAKVRQREFGQARSALQRAVELAGATGNGWLRRRRYLG